LIALLAKLYRKQLAKVKVAGTLSEWFPFKKGVRQGCVLSPYLFNILAKMVMRETLDGFQGGLVIGGRMITNLRYADDIILGRKTPTPGQNTDSRRLRLRLRFHTPAKKTKNLTVANWVFAKITRVVASKSNRPIARCLVFGR